jgi:hypothetical protein
MRDFIRPSSSCYRTGMPDSVMTIAYLLTLPAKSKKALMDFILPCGFLGFMHASETNLFDERALFAKIGDQNLLFRSGSSHIQ